MPHGLKRKEEEGVWSAGVQVDTEVKGMIIQVEVTGSERDTWQEARGR
jgi:hypothetical protein